VATGASDSHMGFLVTLAGAVFFAFHGSLSLLPIESRPLGSTLVIIAGLLLAMLPHALLLGLPGYAIKRCLLLVSLRCTLGILLRRRQH
jgi:hypothetical protein